MDLPGLGADCELLSRTAVGKFSAVQIWFGYDTGVRFLPLGKRA